MPAHIASLPRDKLLTSPICILGTLTPGAERRIEGEVPQKTLRGVLIMDLLKINPLQKGLRGIRASLLKTQNALRRMGFTFTDGVFMSQEIPSS